MLKKSESIFDSLLRRVTINLTVVCTCILFLAAISLAQSPSSKHEQQVQMPSGAQSQTPTQNLKIPDVEVLDQNGQKVHFYSDLVKGKLVVINLIFTTCTAMCPLSGQSFARLQTVLGDKLGRDVYLVSVSIDPETDTPELLKDWGTKFGAKPGWTLVTGGKFEIEEVVKAFTGSAPNKYDHSPVAFLIDEQKGVRIRAYGLGNSYRWSQLIAQLKSASSDSGRQ